MFDAAERQLRRAGARAQRAARVAGIADGRRRTPYAGSDWRRGGAGDVDRSLRTGKPLLGPMCTPAGKNSLSSRVCSRTSTAIIRPVPTCAILRSPGTPQGPEPGCTIFVKLWQFDLSDRTTVVSDMNERDARPDAEQKGRSTLLLHRDARETVTMGRLGAGRRAAARYRQAAWKSSCSRAASEEGGDTLVRPLLAACARQRPLRCARGRRRRPGLVEGRSVALDQASGRLARRKPSGHGKDRPPGFSEAAPHHLPDIAGSLVRFSRLCAYTIMKAMEQESMETSGTWSCHGTDTSVA